MTLAFSAAVLQAPAKRIQNACAYLQRSFTYRDEDICRLGLAFWLVDSFVMELGEAWHLAGEAFKARREVVRFGHRGGPVLEIDMGRYLSEWALSVARVRDKEPPRSVGRPPRNRPPRSRNALQAARDFGIDVAALSEGLKRSPEERLRSLDENWRFLRDVRVGGRP